jgi:DNA-binding transcriptional LysR family regulator
MDAFHEANCAPRVEMEATSTAIIVRMVEAGLGLSLVPLMPNGVVTRSHRVGVRKLPGLIRPIHSGVITRKADRLLPSAEAFVQFLKQNSS